MYRLQLTVIVAALIFEAHASLADIVIATSGPITGRYAPVGEQMRRGVEMAVADLNAKGGVLGQKVKLLIFDDECDPKQAVAVAKKVVKAGAVFMAGHFCSGSSIAALPVYTKARILQISPSSTSRELTEMGADNVFRVSGRNDQQGFVAGNYLAKVYKGKKVAIIHNNTPYGKDLAIQTKGYMNAAGLGENMYLSYPVGKADHSAIISKLKDAKVDAIYYSGYYPDVGSMIRQAYGMGYKAQFISGDAIATKEFWKITGRSGEGTIMTFHPDPRHGKAASTVVNKFRAQKYEPEGYTLFSYAAVQAWAAAVKNAGSTELAKVVSSLRSQKFSTVLGKISFDAKGDVIPAIYKMYKWRAGVYAEATGVPQSWTCYWPESWCDRKKKCLTLKECETP